MSMIKVLKVQETWVPSKGKRSNLEQEPKDLTFSRKIFLTVNI